MKINTFVHKLTKIVVDIMFFVGIAACCLLPFGINMASRFLMIMDKPFWVRYICLLTPGIAAVFIMWQLKVLFKTLLGGNPFVIENIAAFRRIAMSCFVAGVVYLAVCIVYPTIGIAIVVAVCAVAGLFCLTLKDVFKQAMIYKEENDLTV